MKKGFTLVEILVGVIIIALLSSVTIPQFAGMQERARDTERITDIKNLQIAIERYFDQYGQYPDVPGAKYAVSGDPACYTSGDKTAFNDSGLSALVTQGLISRLPADPDNSPGSNHCYLYRTGVDCSENTSSRYVLLFNPENYDTFGGEEGGENGAQNWVNNNWLCVEP